MPIGVVGDVFPDACRFGDGFQITVDCLVARHGENGLLRLLSVISGIPRYQLLGRLQQRHRHTLRSLLAVVVEPMRAVYPQRDVLIRQHQNIHVSHARIDGEHEYVPRNAQVGRQRDCLEPPDFFLRKIPFFHILLVHLQQAYRVVRYPLILYGQIHNPLEPCDMLQRPVDGTANRTFTAVALQVGEELIDKSLVYGLYGIV